MDCRCKWLPSVNSFRCITLNCCLFHFKFQWFKLYYKVFSQWPTTLVPKLENNDDTRVEHKLYKKSNTQFTRILKFCEIVTYKTGLYARLRTYNHMLTWFQPYSTPEMERVQHKCTRVRVRLLWTCMSMSTQKTNVLEYEYDYFTIFLSTITLECTHDYFHDYFNKYPLSTVKATSMASGVILFCCCANI